MEIGQNYKYIVNPETGRKVSIFGKTGRNIISNFINFSLGGANDVHQSSEFFANDSGRYSDSPQSLENSSYGSQSAVSHGVESSPGMVGPDLGPSPGASGTQTGGSFPVVVTLLSGKTLHIDLNQGDTVQKIAEIVAEVMNKPVEGIRILYAGKAIPNDTVLDIDNSNSTLFAIYRENSNQSGGKGSGHDVHFPSEFFGNDSGRYSDSPQSLESSSYGSQSAVSYGVESSPGMVGPDMGPSPGASGTQTGGANPFLKIVNPATGRKVSIHSKVGREVINGFLEQSGGKGSGHDVHFPSEFFGNDSGRYSDSPQSLENSSYGSQSAVSYGVESSPGMVGPDMGPSPSASGTQTGGG